MSRRKHLGFPCFCGHREERHNFDPYSAFFGCCQGFFSNFPGDADPESGNCDCQDYRADNLKYLEICYGKKKTR